MPIKVSLNDDAVILIESSGQTLRREVGWAAERVCELLRTHKVTGILADSSLIQKQSSPALSGEMISGFLLAMDPDIPLAYVRPAAWTEGYYQRVMEAIEEVPASSRLFDQIGPAQDWLRETQASKATLS